MPKSVFTDAYAHLLRVLVATRKATGTTQVELSRKLGKPQPWVSNYERGIRRLDVVEFYAVARALRRDPVELFQEVVRAFPKNLKV